MNETDIISYHETSSRQEDNTRNNLNWTLNAVVENFLEKDHWHPHSPAGTLLHDAIVSKARSHLFTRLTLFLQESPDFLGLQSVLQQELNHHAQTWPSDSCFVDHPITPQLDNASLFRKPDRPEL
jgi:hypothetical protein